MTHPRSFGDYRIGSEWFSLNMWCITISTKFNKTMINDIELYTTVTSFLAPFLSSILGRNRVTYPSHCLVLKDDPGVKLVSGWVMYSLLSLQL